MGLTGVAPPRLTGIITGAAGGHGHRIAVELARRGDELLLLDRTVNLADAALEAAQARHELEALPLDLADAEALTAAAAGFASARGGLDFLVVAAERRERKAFVDGDPHAWHEIVETNVLGALFAVRAVLPLMLGAGRGHIVLLSGVAGRESSPGAALYGATKWAVTGLGHALRSETEPSGVVVTIVEPSSSPEDAGQPAPGAGPGTQEWGDGLDAAVARTVAFVLDGTPAASVTEVVVRSRRPAARETQA